MILNKQNSIDNPFTKLLFIKISIFNEHLKFSIGKNRKKYDQINEMIVS